MPRLLTRTWPATPDAPGPRRERQAITYQAHVPDPLAGTDPALPARVAGSVSAAERALAELDVDPPRAFDLEAVARRLLRTDSVASSRIEGLVLSQRRLARAEADPEGSRDVTARAVLGNVAAMERAIHLATRPSFGAAELLSIHGALMQETGPPDVAGRLRDRQNWIGGNAYNPGRAEFVPPPPELLPALVDDLCAFVRRTDLPPVHQAAVAHVQFETIHPFADGNGRVGRALYHVVLRRRGLARRALPPISLVLAADARAYVAGLTAYREGDAAAWVLLFAEATRRAALEARELAARVARVQESWRERAGLPRRHSSAEALIRLLPAHPVITLATATTLLGRSRQAANEGIATLARAGVLRALGPARRGRAWEAPEIFRLLDATERALSAP